jgi:hypothetical protein
LGLIGQYQDQIVWRKEYHIYWKKDQLLNQQIVFLLLLSKFRRDFNNQILNNLLINGITINIIKYLCHFTSPNVDPPSTKNILNPKNGLVVNNYNKDSNKKCFIF